MSLDGSWLGGMGMQLRSDQEDINRHGQGLLARIFSLYKCLQGEMTSSLPWNTVTSACDAWNAGSLFVALRGTIQTP